MRLHGLLLPIALALACLASPPAQAITIKLDYTYDTGGFFPVGSQSRATLEAAATFFSNILEDTFSPITVPAPYHSSAPGSTSVYTWTWERAIFHPSTGASITIPSGNIAANDFIVYAGARPLSGSTAGEGGPGGSGWNRTHAGCCGFTTSDNQNALAIDQAFAAAINTRGETSGFARWGGFISFDTSSRTWHTNHNTAPVAGSTDLFSVAIHELAHTLGFGASDEWNARLSGGNFTGPNARSWYHSTSTVPTASGAHWANGTNSFIYGTTTKQEAAMDPSLSNGTRKRFTDLDAAALRDIGWTIDTLIGDYDANRTVGATDYVLWRINNGKSMYMTNDQSLGTVTNADYDVWRSNYGDVWADPVGGASFQIAPEPSAAILAIFAYIAASAARRKRRG